MVPFRIADHEESGFRFRISGAFKLTAVSIVASLLAEVIG